MTAQRLPLDQIPTQEIEPIADAMVVAVGDGSNAPGGVFRADGSFCELSRTRISRDRLTETPGRPAPEGLEYLRGRYLFGGLARHHFGHFMLETLARLWALGANGQPYDGLILLPMPDMDFAATLRRRVQGFLQDLGCTMPIHLLRAPVMVEHLDVPTQGFGHGDWTIGSPAFRDYVRQRVDLTCPPSGPDKIYISRRKLKHDHQSLETERKIEKLMTRAGYRIVHPQRESLRNQCRLYRAAHTIVGGDGSAFHLVPFAMQPETRIGLIARRDRPDVVESIAMQIEAFAPVNLVRLNPLSTPDDGGEPVVSFRRLKRQLERAHLI